MHRRSSLHLLVIPLCVAGGCGGAGGPGVEAQMVSRAGGAGAGSAGGAGGAGEAGEAAADPLHVLPRDLCIDLTVLAPPLPQGHESAAEPGAAAAHRRSGRYIVFPDGSLHSSDDAGDVAARGPGFLPGLTRTLSRDQLAGLWGLALQVGLADPARGVPPIDVSRARPAHDRLIYILSFAAHDRRWMFIESPGPGAAPDPAMAQFVREVCALAWVSDEAPAADSPPVRRYDFGPDPYARYREP
jgi:hypothetical protein